MFKQNYERPESWYLSQACFEALREFFDEKADYLDYETCRWADGRIANGKAHTNIIFLREFKKNISQEKELIKKLINAKRIERGII